MFGITTSVTQTRKNIRNYLSTYIYRHVIWGNVWELTCDESPAWNTILEHRLRASLVGHLWPECSWMKPFWYGTYPRAPRVTCATDRHRHNGREDPLTWSLRSFTVAYGVRYCLTLLNMKCAQICLWRVHTKLKKPCKKFVLPFNCSYLVSDFWASIIEQKLMLNTVTWWDQFWLFTFSIRSSRTYCGF